MELNRYNEAQNICEDMLQHKNEDYYHYLHIYLTLLFQTNQYQLLMEQVEFALEDASVPDEMTDLFWQLYKMSKNMQHEITLEQSHYFEGELTEAVHNKDHHKQWRLIEKLKSLKIAPTEGIYKYLTD